MIVSDEIWERLLVQSYKAVHNRNPIILRNPYTGRTFWVQRPA